MASSRDRTSNSDKDVLYIKFGPYLRRSSVNVVCYFQFRQNIGVALTEDWELNFIDHSGEGSGGLLYTYDLLMMFEELGVSVAKVSAAYTKCFSLASEIIAFKIKNKLLFFSLSNPMQNSFSMQIPTLDEIFKLNDELILGFRCNYQIGTVKFLLIKWRTLQMKFIAYTSRIPPVDIKIMPQSFCQLVHKNSGGVADDLKSNNLVLAFLYSSGLVDIFDVLQGRIITVIIPKWKPQEYYCKLFYLEDSNVFVQASFNKLLFWDCTQNALKPTLLIKLALRNTHNSKKAQQIGDEIMFIDGNSIFSFTIDPQTMRIMTTYDIVDDDFSEFAPKGYTRSLREIDIYTQSIRRIFPLDNSSFVIQRDIRAEVESSELSIDTQDYSYSEEEMHSLTIVHMSRFRNRRQSSKFILEYKSCLNNLWDYPADFNLLTENGEFIFWGYKTSSIFILRAKSDAYLGWQDYVYRVEEISDFTDQKITDFLCHQISDTKFLIVYRHEKRGLIGYTLLNIPLGGKAVNLVSGSLGSETKFILPVNEKELVLQAPYKTNICFYRIDAYKGTVMEVICQKCPDGYRDFVTVSDADQVFVLIPKLFGIAVLFAKKKTLKTYNLLQDSVRTAVYIRNKDVLAVTWHFSQRNVSFVNWRAGEILKTFECVSNISNKINIVGSFGREILLSSEAGPLMLLDSKEDGENTRVLNFKEPPVSADFKSKFKLKTAQALEIQKFSMTSFKETTNSAYFIMTMNQGPPSSRSFAKQIGVIKRTDRRFLVLKLMKMVLGETHNYYTIRYAFLMLFPPV